MKRYIVLTLLFVFSSARAFSQSDTLNQTNSDGEKQGWWMTYLDENLVVLKDSIGATHCMYNYYLDDIFLHRYGKGLGSKKYPIQFPADENMKIGNYKLLNGDYITKYKNGNNHSILSASEGILNYYKEFYPDGQLKQEFVHTKACGAPIRHCIREYDKDGVMNYEGYNWLPKHALAGAADITQNSNQAENGSLDGNSYQIEVKQISGENNENKGVWPMDKLIFDAGKMFSEYMQESEHFFPSDYHPSSSNIELDSIVSFKYENISQNGSFLRIIGTVQGTTIKGTISRGSGANKITRTYSFEGVLI